MQKTNTAFPAFILIGLSMFFMAVPCLKVSAQNEPRLLIELNGYASCLVYEVQNNSGAKIELPEGVQLALDCTPNTPAISPDFRFIAIFTMNSIIQFDFKTESVDTLMKIPEDTEGISDFLYSDNGKALSFILINREIFPMKTKLVAFYLVDGVVMNNWNYDARINYSCDGLCSSIAMRDFWFVDDRTLGYTTYRNEPYDWDNYKAERFIKLY